jgi:osmotically-inducible protein OsmY
VDGVAHLKGQIWSNDEIRFAHDDAAAVPGVKDVDDEMELVRGGAR